MSEIFIGAALGMAIVACINIGRLERRLALKRQRDLLAIWAKLDGDGAEMYELMDMIERTERFQKRPPKL